MSNEQVWLSVREGCALLGIERSALNRQILAGQYISEIVTGNGGEQYRIRLDSLPAQAQARYYADRAQGNAQAEGQADQTFSKEDEGLLWSRFENASAKLKTRAETNLAAVIAWHDGLMQGKARMALYSEIHETFGLSRKALNDWLKTTEGYPRHCWLALVLPNYRGLDNVKKTQWTPAAWDYFLAAVLTPGAKIRTAWQRTCDVGAAHGWVIPSYDTAKRDYRNIPVDVRTYVKEGPTALKSLSPTQRRDYTTLALHELWCLDGRKIDLMIRDQEGKLGKKGQILRPYVLVIQEVRSRVILGYAVSASLDLDVVRRAFMSAMKRTDRIIPRHMLMDNGMENAAKEISGGSPTRRRGKVSEDEIIGLFPMLGVEVEWPHVAHGQAKPIERAFRTIAGRTEPRPEFRGAYCGHTPEARPEEWDAQKAAPLGVFLKILDEEIESYHRTPHRGQGMELRSPMQVYTDLSSTHSTVARRISEAQARMCMYSATSVTLNRRDHAFTLHGNRYWTETLSRLIPGKGYYARYDPNDLTQPVYLYQRDKLLCEVPMTQYTGFRDKQAAKTHAKRVNTYKRAVKMQANALQALHKNQSVDWQSLGIDPETGEILMPSATEPLPIPKVVEMVRTRVETIDEKRNSPAAQENAEILELMRSMEEKLAAEQAPKRALGST